MDNQSVATTVYSLTDAPPAPAERRDADRHMTLYRVGSVSLGDRRELCLIKNISAGGMMIRAYCAMVEGDALSIELKSGQPISGMVSWVRASEVGIAFDSPIDVLEILSTNGGQRPRKPRIEVSTLVTLRDGATTLRVRSCDISQGGMKVSTETVLPVGTDVIVTLAGLDPQRGVVRWSEHEFTGITFNRTIALPVLVEWLQALRETMRAAG